MFGHSAVYAGRRLAACAYANGIALKLPAHLAEALIAQARAVPFQPYGKARMWEWGHFRAATCFDVAKHTNLIAQSIAFVAEHDRNRGDH
ncbi:hypothetical protein BH24ACT14_BH24ACT14_15590 [soil metagenome]